MIEIRARLENVARRTDARSMSIYGINAAAEVGRQVRQVMAQTMGANRFARSA